MFVFKFETNFDNKDELHKEIKDLLWKIEHTWPVIMCGGDSKHIKWITDKTNEFIIKIRRQELEFKKGP